MNSTITSALFKTLGLTLISATALVACDRDEKIDESTAQETISQNLTVMTDTMVNTITPFEQSEAFGVEGEEFFGGGEDCYYSYDASTGNDIETCEPYEGPDFDAEMTTARDQLIDLMGEYVFRDDQIEEQKRREITYLMKGSNLCKELRSDAGEYSECVTLVDDAQIRLVITSPEEGDIDIDLFFGQNKRYNPGTLSIWRDRIGVEGDLQNIKDSAKFLANIVGEDISDEFPPTFEGRFSLEMSKSGARTMSMTASVLQAIKIANPSEKYDVFVGVASPAGSFTIDGGARTFSGEAKVGAVRVKFPETSYDYESVYDDMGNWVSDEETVTEYLYDFGMAGLTGKTTFDVEQEKVSITGASLGNGPVTFDVDGNRVFSMDLDRPVNATITEPNEKGVQIDVSPATMNMNFSFKNLMAKMEEFGAEDWMLDEQLQISVSGDAPSFLLDYDLDQIKAIAGKLSLKATQRNVEVVVEGDQCLLDEYLGRAPVETCGGEGCSSDMPSMEVHDDHPLAYIEAGACK